MKGFSKLTPLLQRLASERLRDKVKQPQRDGFIRREVDRVGDATLLKLYGVGGTVLGASTFGYSIFMPGFLIVLAALPPVGHVPLPDVTTCSGMISDWIQVGQFYP